jgi:replicative DNA helicase
MSDQTRPIPHSLVAEKSVLSIFLQDPTMLLEAEHLGEDHFHLPGHREIFSMLRQRAATGQVIEITALVQALLDQGKLDQVGGPSTLVDLLTYQPTTQNLRHYMELLGEKLARRIAIQTARTIDEAAHEAEDANELLNAIGSPITAIQDALLSLKPTEDMQMVIKRVLDNLRDKIEGKRDPMGIKTGIPAIDRKFLGLHPGRTTVISGYPSGGKSVLAGQFCAEAFLDGHRTLFISLEMSKEQLTERLLCYVARIKGKAISNPREYAMEESDGKIQTIDKRTLQSIKSATMRMREAPFDIEHLTGANEQMIAAVIRKHHRKDPLKLVAVDFIQRTRPSSDTKHLSREQQISQASKVLADLAQELGLHMIILSQLNKEGAAKHAEAINEDCDLHLQILQDRETKEHRGIGVPKDRHSGQMGSVLPIVLNEEFIRFEEQIEELQGRPHRRVDFIGQE